MLLTVLALFYSQSHIRSRYTEELLTVTSTNISNSYIEQAKQRASTTLNYLVDAVVDPMYFFDLDGIRYVVEPVTNDNSIQKVVVFDQEGKIFHSSHIDDRYGQRVHLPELEHRVLGLSEIYEHISQESLMLAAPLKLQNNVLGGVLIVYSMEAVHNDILEHEQLVIKLSESNESLFNQLNFFVFVIITVLSLFLSLNLANRLIRPIYSLLKHSKRLQTGEYGTYNTISSKDELSELARSINDVDVRLEERTAEIEFLAFNDSLTKLPNRVTLIRHIQHLIDLNVRQYQPFAILFIDLDGFKRVNDSFGHQAGDELLCTVADRINRRIKESNSSNIAARVGGDEFVVCALEDTTQASTMAETLLEEIREPMVLTGCSELFNASASVGIVSYSNLGDLAEELIKKSDLAMYSSKSLGKNQCTLYSQQLEDSLSIAEEMERDLRLAIGDYQDFEVWYQPKVRLQDGSTVGYEALVRWKHPEKGFISPADFIPIAESTGLIVDLGKWVFDQVIKDTIDFQMDSNLSISVNVSAKQLRDQDLIAYLESRIKESGIEPHQLQVEVTETALMENWQVAIDTLMQIRALGVEIWLDDFGTGYASLSYLQKLPVDGLKIDRSFVSGQDLNMTNNVLCSAIISMAKKLSIRVVAEGIETKEQAKFLKSEQCEFGQGYFYSKPLPIGDVVIKTNKHVA